MISIFIYASQYTKEEEGGENCPRSVTMLFCERNDISLVEVQGEIKAYYEKNYQTDELYIICGEHNKKIVEEIFITQMEKAFKDIPRLEIDHLSDNLSLLVFNKNGKLAPGNGKSLPKKEVLDKFIRDGLVHIFQERGGLIEANGNAHHFVFPSGKHSDKFLRTGNILLHSAEIYFIAFNLLSFYKEAVHKKIFCDTSSINSIAFALLDLKRKLIGNKFNPISIVSFSSYDGLFSNKIKFFQNALILVSSSTSGNIIDKIIKHDERIIKENIAILYFLGPRQHFYDHKSNIICDLTWAEDNPKGIQFYDTFSEKDCIYCKQGSYAVEIKGDVFLLEKPKIKRVTINVTDAPKGLSAFVDQFKSVGKNSENILKVNYKESNVRNNIKYEVYFDMFRVIENLEEKYPKYRKKLNHFINQYIPSNAKYFVCLPDEGSKRLGDYILSKIKDNYQEEKVPVLIDFDRLGDIDPKETGAIVIVASCISNGKNLLFLSRALRTHEKLRLIYFIGLTTTSDEDYRNFLRSNLTHGAYGKDSNSFIEVENFYCNKDSKNTSWVFEKEFLKQLAESLEEQEMLSLNTDLLKDRINLIDESMAKEVKGLCNKLFYPTTANDELELRKGFAFFTTFQDYVKDVSQADVYFTISAVINNLRYSKSQQQTLQQSEFVRNLIDPGNFNRYNDGVIQASILRSAYPSELCYHIDEVLSASMYLILEKIISEHDKDQGEGLIEFLYAIAIQKLTLKKDHILKISESIGIIDNDLIKIFKFHIDNVILKAKLSLTDENEKLKLELLSLKARLQESAKAV